MQRATVAEVRAERDQDVMTETNDEKTHFGYQTVDAKSKAGMVGQVFDSVASKYDVMNDLMSCLLYTSPSPRDGLLSRMPSSA